MRKAAPTAALLLAAAVLAGCGGSSAKSPASGGTTAPANSTPGTDVNFSKLLNNLGRQSYKVTYTDAGGNTQMYAQDGQGRTVTVNGNSQVFTTPTAAITCMRADATAPFTCTQAPANLGANSSYIALAVAERTYASALAYHLAHTSTKTIAGHTAACFTISAPDFKGAKGIAGAAGTSLKGVAAYCNDRATGALLENTITDESGATTTNLLVTKYETPTAKDFQPPATPTVITVRGGPVTVPGGVAAQ
jgi:hypothetical protein